MATLAQLETALVNANKAGDLDAVRRLAQIVKTERESRASSPYYQVPGAQDLEVPGTTAPKPESSLAEKAVGMGEAALTTVSGATTGTAGMIGGFLKALAQDVLSGKYGTQAGADIVAQNTEAGADALTYSPKTEAGQRYVGRIGEVMQQAAPLLPAAAELGAIGEAASAARPVIRAAAREATAPIATAATDLAQQVKAKISGATTDPATGAPVVTPGTGQSAGAAAVDLATQRRMAAEELGFKGDTALTEGQATRDFAQQRFERETAKLPDIGEPIRQRMQNQNAKLQQVMDSFIDNTGAELTDVRGVGEIVDKVLSARKERDKTRTRILYTEARKSDESKLPAPADTKVSVKDPDGMDVNQSPIDYLNSRPTNVETSKAVDDARSNGVHLGVIIKNDDGTYSANPNATVGRMEDWRREISQSLSRTASDTEIRDVTILKKLIDGVTEPLAGPLYKKARMARAQMARDYQDSFLVKQLLGTKPGSNDRSVALEHVFRKSIIDPGTSVDQISHLHRLLKTEGETGKQAWKELQGGMLRHIKDEALKGVTRDAAGNQIVSASGLDRVVTQLDKTGKLDYVLGKVKAEQVRTINEVAKDVLTAPPGAVNTSNTATVLAGLLDLGLTSMTGIPAPVSLVTQQAISRIKNARLRARVKQSLGE